MTAVVKKIRKKITMKLIHNDLIFHNYTMDII